MAFAKGLGSTMGSNNPNTPEPRTALLEKASKFLDEEEIRAASPGRQKHFLQTKGLTDEEIHTLLNDKRASATEIIYEGEAPSVPAEPTPSDTFSKPSGSSEAQTKDTPPIITYPEFLLRSRKPPPLITADRLLTSIYIASGAAATMYGLSTYVVKPMLENLTSARHSLFESCSSNVNSLNEKLEGIVSQLPENSSNDSIASEDSDRDSITSNPARFFSRNSATQTSPRLSRSSSSSPIALPDEQTALDIHASHLSKLREMLANLNPSDSDASDPVSESLDNLTEYLRDLPLWGSTGRTGINRTNGVGTEKDDIDRIKAEIKSAKGALLSARNFPSGVAAR